jgi:nucleoside-triphosphatase THEP1
MAANLAGKSHWKVAGVISPAMFEQGQKVGVLAENLLTGEQRLLASKMSRKGFDLPVGRWYFSPASLEWGSRVLQGCLPCDLLIVDELGPLELTHEMGWVAGLVALKQSQFSQALVVVRPKLLGVARRHFPGAETINLEAVRTLETQLESWWGPRSQATS